ncbi:hypothetical protein [Rhodoblastus sp.]|uniref:hypothetical protein n=1 Tax=Rhodoblastus sp. TaxID=1962975 RepID=UPI003F9839C4
MDDDSAIARHYAHGALAQAILSALAASGKDLSALTADDLAPVDEFHIGGRQATQDLAAQAASRPDRVCSTSAAALAAPRVFSRGRWDAG